MVHVKRSIRSFDAEIVDHVGSLTDNGGLDSKP